MNASQGGLRFGPANGGLALLASLIFVSAVGAAGEGRHDFPPHAQANGVDLTIQSGVAAGNYSGSISEVLNALGRIAPLTYCGCPSTLEHHISGTVEHVSLSLVLRQILADFSFALVSDAKSGAAHIVLLSCREGSRATKPEVATSRQQTNSIAEAGRDISALARRPQEALDSPAQLGTPQKQWEQFEAAHRQPQLPAELQAQFEVAHQQPELPAELQAQFEAAYQQPELSVELQAQFEVAHQQPELPAELQAQFEVAHQQPELPAELQAQFEVAQKQAELPRRFEAAEGESGFFSTKTECYAWYGNRGPLPPCP